ncbi:hypothetical protein MHY87_10705 [Microvirga sp. ACRRW]|uniref:hypothetical protein n=1 Tax=Microvirga sp. ACRRW TaxID=2918205 RepID=UPI001EF61E2E|nr:hypothetical protein [Microvirga sp. ACRRW]MCG7393376.1 hypothetical protein [Microvirga sp. ACRRW]
MFQALKVLSCSTVFAAAFCTLSTSQAANVPLGQSNSHFGSWQDAVEARFDPQSGNTRVAGRVASGVCFALSLPQEWRAQTGEAGIHLKAAFSQAELEVGLRSAHELRGMPQPDLASRDAALLQQDYENLLGRPAQSVSLASVSTGAIRWSATWFDAYLPANSHGMTIETLIVPMSSDWVLELSVTQVEERERYEALLQSMLAGLRVQRDSDC